MKSLVQSDYCRYFPDGSVHILSQRSLVCALCGQEHWWFINRDGRTRCLDCDFAHVSLLDAIARDELLVLPEPPRGVQ